MYAPQDYFLLRKPSNSVDDILSISQGVSNSKQDQFEMKIVELFSSPERGEAIYLASPVLYAELKKWQRGEKMPPERRYKLALSLYKYLKRMSTRCTPFGTFAGYSNGCVSDLKTSFVFSAQNEKSSHKEATLDMNCLAQVVEHIVQDSTVQHQLIFYPNSSLYLVGDQWRYVEYVKKGTRRSYSLAAVANTSFIESVLSFVEPGKTLNEVGDMLIAGGVGNRVEVTLFIQQLVDSQILVDELNPNVTGKEYLKRILDKLASIDGAQQYVNALGNADQILRKPEIGINDYLTIEKIITQNFPVIDYKNVVQVNTVYPAKQNNLKRSSINAVVKNLNPLVCLCRNSANHTLVTFCEKFVSKYEAQEVPLAAALDSEVGVGYGLHVNGVSDCLPLLNGLVVPSTTSTPSLLWDELAKLKYRLVTKARVEKTKAVRIDDHDLSAISAEDSLPTPLPESAYVAGTIVAASPQRIDDQKFKFFLGSFLGPSCANLLGRFAQNNSELEENLRNSLQEEEETDPNTIYAEVIHLPEARVGNILARPTLRKYEIPYLGQATVPKADQIPLKDLMVSVRDGKVILRSLKHNKRVIPRLSTAHNYHKSLPTYRFLCDLQFQEQELRVFWNWFPFDQEETFLPRVEYKNIILCRAQWRFKQREYPELSEKYTDVVAFFEKLRKQWEIPKHVVVQQGEIELLIDMDNPHCLQHLWQSFKKRDIILSEVFLTPNECMIEVGGKKYTHEIILPLRKIVAQVKPSPLSLVSSSGHVDREFLVGSSWLYTKVYAGNKIGDRVLINTILPLTQKLIRKGTIDKWFFIRYNDPESHLRIRFHNALQPDFWKEVLDQLNEELNPLIQKGVVSQLVVATYRRELERYGTGTMSLSEDMFHADSVAVANVLRAIQGGQCEHYRWLYALKNVDTLLNDFAYTTEKKAQIINRLQNMFFHEFNRGRVKSKLKYSLDQKYRAIKREVEGILAPTINTYPSLKGLNHFDERSNKNRFIIHALRGNQQQGSKLIEEIIPSYIHMTLNRTFLARRRRHELVLYHYLSKYYQSQIAYKKRLDKINQCRESLCEVV